MASNGLTILLTEDEAEIREFSADYLRELGYRVLEAENGAAAARLIESGVSIDVLVTDQGLPGGMTGSQVIALARERRRDLSIVLVTGFADLPPELTNPVLRKPYKMPQLVNLIEQMLVESAGR